MSIPNKSLLKVTVVDALMGSGKTTAAIRMMREMCAEIDREWSGGTRFVYITPFLPEIDRVMGRSPESKTQTNLGDYGWLVKDPQKGKMVTTVVEETFDAVTLEKTWVPQKKLDDFNELLEAG